MKKNLLILIFLSAELLGIFSLFTLYQNLTLAYFNIPNIIPQHYNLDGKADIFGPREILWSDLQLYMGLYLGIGLINLVVFFIKRSFIRVNHTRISKNLFPVISLAVIRFLITGLCGFLFLTEIQTFKHAHANFLFFSPFTDYCPANCPVLK